MKQITLQLRQGDVFLRGVLALRTGKRNKQEDGMHPHGDVTGHSRAIADAEAAELYDIDGEMLLSAGADRNVLIIHQNQVPVIVPAKKRERVRRRAER